MMLKQAFVVVLSLTMTQLRLADGHGYVLDPPQRSSIWRVHPSWGTPVNYDDNQLFCGGASVQRQVNGGKCGICGDAYDAPDPRPNEVGGQYFTGVIVESYTQGQIIDVTVKLTANHLGYFIFKLCPSTDAKKEVEQGCLDSNVLQVVDSAGNPIGTKFYIDSTVNNKHVRLQLPKNMACPHCVLQWTYNTGNSWGCDSTGCCVGCGPQENFVNCVDIRITPANGGDNNSDTIITTTKTPATTATPTPTTVTTAKPAITANPATTRPITTAAATTTEKPKPVTEAPALQTTAKPDSRSLKCRAVGIYTTTAGMDQWCTTNCLAIVTPYCPLSHCKCE